MKAVSYYLLFPFLYLVALSPFWLLYSVSSFFYYIIYYFVGYRKEIVLQNLKNSFPEKTDEELKKIRKKYYKYLCDLFIESLKTTTWSEKHVEKRLKMNNIEIINKLYEQGKSIVIVMGHHGNWEWAGPCFSLTKKHQLNVVYKPLSNPYFESMFIKNRTKFNTRIIPMKKTLRAMAAQRKEICATAFIADQTPSDAKMATWITFLNQDTPVYIGPEKVSKMFDQTVVYVNVDRVKRGYYEVNMKVIFENPKEAKELEITEAFNKMLEEDIRRKPETWLWSHRRWKHNVPNSVN